MIKILDRYLILSFIKSFLFIFSVLFFLFSIQFAFQEISKLVGKGFTLFEISRILFYLGTTTIPMVVPLSILLASINCFGGFGERNELAAMKLSGISLARIMLPVFILSILISIGLFFFSNNILPENHKRAKNLLFNAVNANPALRFVNGQFNSDIPNFTMKIDKIYGKKNDSLKKILIHKQANSYEDQTTIISNDGVLHVTPDQALLKFELYNGLIYDSYIESMKNHNQRLRQPNRITQFDILSIYIDVSKLLDKALDEENIQKHFRFHRYNKLVKLIDSTKKINDSIFLEKANKNFRNLVMTTSEVNSLESDSNDRFSRLHMNLETFNNVKKINILKNVVAQIEHQLTTNFIPTAQFVRCEKKHYARIIIHQQRIIMFPLMCTIFFLIGGSLGSIIRKGGLGIPVIIAIFIFIVWFLIFTLSESESKLGNLDPYISSWLPNLILFPIGIFLTKKAMEDSEFFDFDTYKKSFVMITTYLFNRKNREY